VVEQAVEDSGGDGMSLPTSPAANVSARCLEKRDEAMAGFGRKAPPGESFQGLFIGLPLPLLQNLCFDLFLAYLQTPVRIP